MVLHDGEIPKSRINSFLNKLRKMSYRILRLMDFADRCSNIYIDYIIVIERHRRRYIV